MIPPPYSEFPEIASEDILLREITPEDVATTKLLIEDGSLSFDGLISNVSSAKEANKAYNIAFNNAECLKMVLDWRNAA